jgi:hypothetical protein
LELAHYGLDVISVFVPILRGPHVGGPENCLGKTRKDKERVGVKTLVGKRVD